MLADCGRESRKWEAESRDAERSRVELSGKTLTPIRDMGFRGWTGSTGTGIGVIGSVMGLRSGRGLARGCGCGGGGLAVAVVVAARVSGWSRGLVRGCGIGAEEELGLAKEEPIP